MNKCLVCGSNKLYNILDLGIHPNSDTFISQNLLSKTEPLEQLGCCLCKKCGMIQNKIIINEDERYNLYDYSYTSSNSNYAKEHWDGFINFLENQLNLNKKSKILEVGSNDGYLSKKIKNKKINVVCNDASKTMCDITLKKGLKTYPGIFNKKLSQKILKKEGKFDFLIANNVFNHSNNPQDFIKGVSNLLVNNGFFVFEVLYWKDMVINRRFDHIYHEHISYFTGNSLSYLLRRNKLNIEKIYRNNYHGGTLRVVARKSKKNKNIISLTNLIKDEKRLKLFNIKTYSKFQKDINELKIKFNKKIFNILNNGYKIIGIGAGAKSNTFINFMKLDNASITCITDISKFKINKFMPMSRIPIKKDSEIKKYKKVYALILSWNINTALIKKLKKIKKNIKIISQLDF